MNKTSPLYEISKYLVPYKFRLLVVLVALTIVSASILGLGYALKMMVDVGLKSSNGEMFLSSIKILVGMIIALAISSYMRASSINKIASNLERDIKKDLYSHIVTLPSSFFEKYNTGEIMTRMSVDIEILNGLITNISSSLLRNVLMCIGGVILMLLSSIKLSLIVIAIVPLILFPIFKFIKKIRALSREKQANLSSLATHIHDTTQNIKIIQSYNNELLFADNFAKLADKLFASNNVLIEYRAILSTMLIGLVLSSIALVLWIGGISVINNQLSAGTLTSFIFYAILVASSLSGLSDVMGEVHKTEAAAERVLELKQYQSAPKIPKDNKKVLGNFNKLSFNQVDFSYPQRPETPILQKFNLQINKGDKIAITGASGIGKSTILQLLLRFYDVNSGEIDLNGENIINLDLSQLRNHFALVSQDAFIFYGTAYDNIKFGKLDASDKQITEAARKAGILDFLESLPNKMQTPLGEQGQQLSGGQKQRISLARAILKNPEILLLDEATNSLDSENENKIFNEICQLMQDKTIIAISHNQNLLKGFRIVEF